MTATIDAVGDETTTADEIVGRDGQAGHDRERSVAQAGLPRFGLAALAIVVALGRLAYSHERTIFHLIPDEPATLGVARWMSGSGSWNMFDADVWRPGAALLITPIYWVTDDQTLIIRLALVVAAIIAGWSAIWLARIVDRLTGLEPIPVLIISGAVALMPAGLSASAFVWAEPLVSLTFLATLWHLMCYIEHRAMRHALGTTAWASIGLVSHNRLMPVVIVVVTMVVVLALRARRPREAASAATIAVVMVLAGRWLGGIVVAKVWDNPGEVNTIGSTLHRLANPLAVVDAAVGQLWYMLTASALLAGLGVIALTRSAIRDARPRSLDALLVLGLTGIMVATSIVFMSDRWRTDHFVYGRYNDAVAWPVVAVGAAWLVGAFRGESRVAFRWTILAPIAVCATLTLVVIGRHGDEFERFPAFSTMIAGLQPVMGRSYILEPAVAALAAFVAFGLLLVASRTRGAVLAVATLLLLVGGVATRHTVAPKVNFSQRTEIVQELAGDVIPAGSTVGVRFTPDAERPPIPMAYQATYWYLYQWFLDDMTFVVDHGPDDGVGPYVFSVVDDPAMVSAGANVLWTDPDVPLALWQEPTK